MTQETRLVPRTVARIASIQAHYQWQMRPNQLLSDIIQEFMTCRFKNATYDLGWDEEISVDLDFFQYLVPLAQPNLTSIENALRKFLPKNWVMECMDPSILGLFRCGGAEAVANTFVPKPIIMNEYMVCARALLLPNHWGMVNAVLDKLFDELRPLSETPSSDLSSDSNQT